MELSPTVSWELCTFPEVIGNKEQWAPPLPPDPKCYSSWTKSLFVWQEILCFILNRGNKDLYWDQIYNPGVSSIHRRWKLEGWWDPREAGKSEMCSNWENERDNWERGAEDRRKHDDYGKMSVGGEGKLREREPAESETTGTLRTHDLNMKNHTSG